MFPPVIIFTAISLRYFTNPAHAIAGTTLNTPEAFTDTRVLGAFTLTVLIMLTTFLFSRDRLWLGHLQLAVFMAAALVTRIFGFLHDGTTLAMGNQRFITIVETVFLILNAAGLLLQIQLRNQSEARP
jgi:intracellular septation protein A